MSGYSSVYEKERGEKETWGGGGRQRRSGYLRSSLRGVCGASGAGRCKQPRKQTLLAEKPTAGRATTKAKRSARVFGFGGKSSSLSSHVLLADGFRAAWTNFLPLDQRRGEERRGHRARARVLGGYPAINTTAVTGYFLPTNCRVGPPRVSTTKGHVCSPRRDLSTFRV